jgi:ATP-dependent DNA helicase RecQ
MIRDVYQAIGNYFQVPAGMGKDLSFDFDLGAFSDQYNFQPVIVFNCLRFLEKEGYLMLSEGLMHPSRLHIKAQREELYRFQVENEAYDHFLKVLLRSYGGILSDFVPVSETEIARRSGLDRATVSTNLAQLVKMKIIDYIPRIDKPQIIFLQERLDAKNLVISPEHYRDRHKDAEKRMEAMIRYVQTSNKCRSRLLLSYFGECNARRCGKCDVCIERNKISLNEFEFDHILNRIKPLLKSKACSLKEILESTDPVSEEKVIRALRWLIDNEKVVLGEEDLYTWKRK